MKCPRCIEKMEPVEIAGNDAWSCIYCLGHWVEYETLETIINKLNSEQETRIPPKLSNIDSLVPGKRKCPSCTDSVLHLLKSEEIELDVCKSCNGLFFDDGELEQVAGEIPDKEGMPALGWVAIAIVARLALGGGSSG